MQHSYSQSDFVSPSSFQLPEWKTVGSAWLQHAPFAFWLMETHRPATFVELGTHRGYSYMCFCQQASKLSPAPRCFAVDTWQGDIHSGFYDPDIFDIVEKYNARYSNFSTLLRSTFDDAVEKFEDQSIDLLHIDGRHFYEDVEHDFKTWLPKLSERAVALFHDTQVKERDFGVYKYWNEVSGRYPSFEFLHGYGLGVLGVGRDIGIVAKLFDAGRVPQYRDTIRSSYETMGREVESQVRASLEKIGQPASAER